jgi:hypothetical protein
MLMRALSGVNVSPRNIADRNRKQHLIMKACSAQQEAFDDDKPALRRRMWQCAPFFEPPPFVLEPEL